MLDRFPKHIGVESVAAVTRVEKGSMRACQHPRCSKPIDRPVSLSLSESRTGSSLLGKSYKENSGAGVSVFASQDPGMSQRSARNVHGVRRNSGSACGGAPSSRSTSCKSRRCACCHSLRWCQEDPNLCELCTLQKESWLCKLSQPLTLFEPQLLSSPAPLETLEANGPSSLGGKWSSALGMKPVSPPRQVLVCWSLHCQSCRREHNPPSIRWMKKTSEFRT